MSTEQPVQPPAIVYFDIRARAEPIRLIHEELGISYVDERVPAADWPTYR